MNRSLRYFIALAAIGAATGASAEPQKLTFSTEASEVQVKNVILPLSATSSLVETPCSGCAPRSHAVTATTQYFVNKDEVTLEQLRAAITGKPDLVLTVMYVLKTGNLISVTADIPTKAAPARR